MSQPIPQAAGSAPRLELPPAFGRFAWAVLGYCLLVIVYGAWVRITGSGAGCGEHWPTCNGEVIPRSPGARTVIEFTHRVTSGLLGPLILALVVWAFRRPASTRVRVSAVATALLVVFEALLGAGLVLKGLVADDASVARACVVGLHLCNTLLLVAAATLTAFFGSGGGWAPPSRLRPWVAASLAVTALLGLSGAVTALGDTLFPVAARGAGEMMHELRMELTAGGHFLVQLRVIHPALAVVLGMSMLLFTTRIRPLLAPFPARIAAALVFALAAQLGLGALNIVLGAPGWLQLVHLLGAQGIWILMVLLLATIREKQHQ